MNYKLISPVYGDLIDQVLENRGVEDFKSFLNPQYQLPETSLIKNIDRGIKILNESIKENKNICIVVDSDVDGLSSSAVLYRFITKNYNNVNVSYFIHQIKEHGITDRVLNFCFNNNIDLLILPDAGTNDFKQIDILYDKNINVLILDHHIGNEVNEKAIIINNQLDEYLNKNYTGVGVTFLFAYEMYKRLNLSWNPENDLDLVALGMIADGVTLKDNEIRGIIYEALNKCNNLFIKTIINSKEIEFNPIACSWNIAPLINAVVRSGTIEVKDLVFQALCEENKDQTFVIPKRKLNKETRKYEIKDIEYNFFEYVLEICGANKSNQKTIIDPIMDELKKQYDENKNVQIFIIENIEDCAKSMTGLIANKMKTIYGKPCLILWKNTNAYSGSARGDINVLDEFKNWCTESNLFIFAQGHQNAFGVEIEFENLEKLKDYIDNYDFNFTSQKEEVFYVDNVYDGYVNVNHIFEVAQYQHLFGNGVEEPEFAIINIKIPKDKIYYSYGNLRMMSEGVTFIKHFAKKAEFENIINNGFGDYINLSAIGRFEIRKWNGKQYPQISLNHFEFETIFMEDTEIINEEYDPFE